MITGLDLEPEAHSSFRAPREEAGIAALHVVKGAVILMRRDQGPL